jgi:hypothetical protein
MKKVTENLKAWQIALGIVLGLIALLSTSYALEVHWNQGPALAAEKRLRQTNDIQGRIFFLESQLSSLCAKYNQGGFPCDCSGFQPKDKGLYLKYDKWLDDSRKRFNDLMG